MSLSSIGQNSVSEFFEEIIYQVSYNEAREQISSFTKDVDNSIVQEALESSMQIMTAGLIMLLISKQEDFIQGVFNTAKGLVLILLASDTVQKYKNKLSGLRGFGFLKKLEFFKQAYSDRVATAQLVLSGANSHFVAESTTQSETSTLNTAMQYKEHMINKDSLHLDLAKTMSSRYNESLMFKLFTKSFTPNDETMIKKILGRDTASTITANDLNQVANFMYVTDSTGNVTGLSEQFLTLLNGLGYIHNK